MIPTFEDLNFKLTRTMLGGKHAFLPFSNGYGASVVVTPHDDGGSRRYYELAITDSECTMMIYTTSITDDVLRHLTPEEVTETLQRIAELPERQPT